MRKEVVDGWMGWLLEVGGRVEPRRKLLFISPLLSFLLSLLLFPGCLAGEGFFLKSNRAGEARLRGGP